MPNITITEFSRGRTRLERALDSIESITLDDLQELMKLSELIGNGGGVCPAEVLADQPVWVGGVKLYQPSVAALEFLQQKLDQWFGVDDEADYFTALVFSRGRHPKRLATLNSKAKAKKAMAAFKMQMGCTYDELMCAVAAAMDGFPVSGPALESENKVELLAFAASLSKEYGSDSDHWLWDQSAQKVLWLNRELNTKINHGRNQAILAFMDKIKAIRAEHE